MPLLQAKQGHSSCETVPSSCETVSTVSCSCESLQVIFRYKHLAAVEEDSGNKLVLRCPILGRVRRIELVLEDVTRRALREKVVTVDLIQPLDESTLCVLEGLEINVPPLSTSVHQPRLKLEGLPRSDVGHFRLTTLPGLWRPETPQRPAEALQPDCVPGGMGEELEVGVLVEAEGEDEAKSEGESEMGGE